MDQIYGTVTRVFDGDTLEMDVEKIADHCVFHYHPTERIRLPDINALELDEEEGIKAKEFLKAKCGKKKIRVDVEVRGPMRTIIGRINPW